MRECELKLKNVKNDNLFIAGKRANIDCNDSQSWYAWNMYETIADHRWFGLYSPKRP